MNIMPAFIVFSAERAELSTAENAKRTAAALKMLQEEGWPYLKAEGKFEDSSEVSFLAFGNDRQLAHLQDYVCTEWQQKCVLRVHPDRTAELVTFGEPSKMIGKWTKVSAAEAHEADAYTYTPDGEYWLCKP